jgi:hypothetical protein
VVVVGGTQHAAAARSVATAIPRAPTRDFAVSSRTEEPPCSPLRWGPRLETKRRRARRLSRPVPRKSGPSRSRESFRCTPSSATGAGGDQAMRAAEACLSWNPSSGGATPRRAAHVRIGQLLRPPCIGGGPVLQSAVRPDVRLGFRREVGSATYRDSLVVQGPESSPGTTRTAALASTTRRTRRPPVSSSTAPARRAWCAENRTMTTRRIGRRAPPSVSIPEAGPTRPANQRAGFRPGSGWKSAGQPGHRSRSMRGTGRRGRPYALATRPAGAGARSGVGLTAHRRRAVQYANGALTLHVAEWR